MRDEDIIELYWQRCESAIEATKEKYGAYCHSIAYNILSNPEDSEECVNDTYLKAWSSIPPAKPDNLKAYLGTITRNLALDKHDRNTAKKRCANADLVYDEISECIPDTAAPQATEELALKIALNKFLGSLDTKRRIIFLQRYWYLSSVKDIAVRRGLSENNVKITLMRLRAKFKKFLEKEGLHI